MKILHLCPANIATGGTDSIHRLVRELNKCGADAKLLYTGKDLSNPQPECYKKYGCEYLVELPKDFDGFVIFPEVFANRILEEQYSKCKVAVNWQGVDVYKWNIPESEQGKFLQRTDALHFTNMQYGLDYLNSLNLNPIKVSDCVDDIFFEPYEEGYRKDIVLYNPTGAKLTDFQKSVMSRATNERGIRFTPIEGYTQEQLADLFRHSKLYIDFGVFSGRERLPRETVLCGCCVLTSNLGAAHYYEDVAIDDKYKMSDIDVAIDMIRYILINYNQCRHEFEPYRQSLRDDRQRYSSEVKELYNFMEANYG